MSLAVKEKEGRGTIMMSQILVGLQLMCPGLDHFRVPFVKAQLAQKHSSHSSPEQRAQLCKTKVSFVETPETQLWAAVACGRAASSQQIGSEELKDPAL